MSRHLSSLIPVGLIKREACDKNRIVRLNKEGNILGSRDGCVGERGEVDRLLGKGKNEGGVSSGELEVGKLRVHRGEMWELEGSSCGNKG